MLFEYGGLGLGDFVLYNDSNKGWTPALVQSIRKPEKEADPPVLGLVVFVTGMHGATYPVDLARHGKEKSQWLTKKEAREAFDEGEKLRKQQEANQLAALKQVEELNKPPEPEKTPEEPAKTEHKKAK